QALVTHAPTPTPHPPPLSPGSPPPPKSPPPPPQVYDTKNIRPCPGIEALSSRHFPPAWQGTLLVPNVIGFQGIRHVKLRDDSASFAGSDLEPMLSPSHPNFRPPHLKICPDGALVFSDWHNPATGP